MGENKHIEELDAFAKKYVKEIPQEKPSIDFAASIMQTIAKESTAKIFKPTALISKKVWFVILTLVLATLFVPFKASEKSVLNLPKLDFSFLPKLQVSNLFESLAISNTVLYSIFLFGLMIVVQTFFLKNYFNKRYN